MTVPALIIEHVTKRFHEQDATSVVDNHLKFEKIPARVNDRIILFNPLELIYIG